MSVESGLYIEKEEDKSRTPTSVKVLGLGALVAGIFQGACHQQGIPLGSANAVLLYGPTAVNTVCLTKIVGDAMDDAVLESGREVNKIANRVSAGMTGFTIGSGATLAGYAIGYGGAYMISLFTGQ